MPRFGEGEYSREILLITVPQGAKFLGTAKEALKVRQIELERK